MEEITSNESRKYRIELGSAAVIQALCALGGIALAIIGLSNIEPYRLLGVASIVLGAGMLVGGGVAATRYTSIIPGVQRPSEIVSGGLALESIAGVACIALGILALCRVVPAVLLPTSAIVFGGAMVLSAGSMERINTMTARFRSFLNVASLVDLLGGAAAIALGILALSNFDRWHLTLIAFLCIGGASLVSGFTLASEASATATTSTTDFIR